MNPDLSPQEQQLLQQLNDIAAPAAPGWWPLAIGWWFVLAILVLALVVSLRLVKRSRQNKDRQTWRVSALRAHRQIQHNVQQNNNNSSTELAALSVLMRRVALAIAPRQQVASLTDDEWLTTLNEMSNSTAYTNGVGQWLLRAPYQRHGSISSQQFDELLDLTGRTIEQAEAQEVPRAAL